MFEYWAQFSNGPFWDKVVLIGGGTLLVSVLLFGRHFAKYLAKYTAEENNNKTERG